MAGTSLIRTPQEISSDWLCAALACGGLELQGTERIGTGQMSQNHRLTYTTPGGATESVVVKLASDDPMSRATGVGMGAYMREVAFYRNLAERLGGPLARCHLAEYDTAEGWFTILLEDVADAAQGDQIAGCTVADARIALAALAALHAPVLNDLAVGASEYLNQPNPLDQALISQLLPGFLGRYAQRIAPEHAELCRRFAASVDAWAAESRPPLGLVHGDFRLDNLLFASGERCVVVDWQTVSWGPALLDASYFIGGCLEVEDRRAHERELVALYHDALKEYGASALSLEQCEHEYRRLCFHGILMTIAASMIVERTPRGDDMFMAWLARNAQQAIDLDAVELLPAPHAGPLPALRPEAADEGSHEPGAEALWNESWYFDAISDAHDLGLYVRLGRLPNQGVCLYTACVCGPGRPTVMLVDAAAPLPDADDERQLVERDGLQAEQACEEPLERFAVRVQGIAEAHEDPAAALRGERGEPVELGLELVWATDGIAYSWRQATRYEIPCTVSGTVRVGEQTIAFSGSGQRDHSWGARDWWAVDWMWSALRLEDGTRTHAVGVPQMPGYGVGYVQREGKLEEIQSVTATEQIRADGLIASARIASGPEPELALEVAPLAFGPLRLEAPDGRVSLFPRAMCHVHATDGREGWGWVEWNRVQRAAPGADEQ